MMPERPLQVIILHNFIFSTTRRGGAGGVELEVNACSFQDLFSLNENALL